MPAPSNPSGSDQYWIDGQPQSGVQKTGNNEGSSQFWGDGGAGGDLFPAAAAAARQQTLTMIGVGV